MSFLTRRGHKVKSIELPETIYVSGAPIKQRRWDVVVEIAGKEVRVDAKSLLPENVKTGIKDLLTVRGGKIGQLYADLLKFAENRYQGHKWFFDKGLRLARDGADEGIDVFKNAVREGLDDLATRQAIMKHLDIDAEDLGDYKRWVSRLLTKLDDFVEIVD